VIKNLPTTCLICRSSKNILPSWQLCHSCHQEAFVETYFPTSEKPFRCSSFKAPFLFSGHLRNMILKWKYNPSIELTRPLSVAAQVSWGIQESNMDFIIPVPPHIDRLRERKVHQTLLLAKFLSRWSGIKIFHGLKRVKSTPSQTELSKEERGRNLGGAFRITKPEMLKNKRVMVIDDVITTGSTIRSLLKEVRSVVPKEIHVRALARSWEHNIQKRNYR